MDSGTHQSLGRLGALGVDGLHGLVQLVLQSFLKLKLWVRAEITRLRKLLDRGRSAYRKAAHPEGTGLRRVPSPDDRLSTRDDVSQQVKLQMRLDSRADNADRADVLWCGSRAVRAC